MVVVVVYIAVAEAVVVYGPGLRHNRLAAPKCPFSWATWDTTPHAPSDKGLKSVTGQVAVTTRAITLNCPTRSRAVHKGMNVVPREAVGRG